MHKRKRSSSRKASSKKPSAKRSKSSVKKRRSSKSDGRKRVKRVASATGRSVTAGNQVARFSSKRALSSGGVVVSHREYIGDITCSADQSFKIQELVINPGNPTTFPWLATIATNFEQYRVRAMRFHFRSTSGNSVASTNTSLGTVVLATQYNVTGTTFASKQQMENYAGGQSGTPAQDLIHAIDVKPSGTPIENLYVRGQIVPAGQDPRLYDLGKFCIASKKRFQRASVRASCCRCWSAGQRHQHGRALVQLQHRAHQATHARPRSWPVQLNPDGCVP